MKALLSSYGAFLMLPGAVASALLMAATLVDPQAGVAGILAGLGVLAARRLLGVAPRQDGLEVLNGVLVGLLLGASYRVSVPALVLLAFAGPLAVLATLFLSQTLERRGLPQLCAPFVVVCLLLLGVGRALLLAAPRPMVVPLGLSLPGALSGWLRALGDIYLSPYPLAGALVLAALLLSSRYLALLSVVGYLVSQGLLAVLGVPPGFTRLVVGSEAMLSAMFLGGLFTVPGGSGLLTGAAAAALTGLLYIGFVGPLVRLALVPLTLPFLLAVWLGPGLLGTVRAGASSLWLPAPALPEESAERLALARARGLGGLGLRAPFFGRWVVYQGWDGAHTHQGPWRHAIDFFRTRDGVSFKGDGEQLTDYYSFGSLVASPVHGRVLDCRGDLADNPPGEVDLANRWGNFVLISLPGGAHVLLAHLQQGSLTVCKGDTVAPGQLLGRCGNSGRSPQPHLHLHVQTSPELGSPTMAFHLSGVNLLRGDQSRFCLDLVPRQGDLLLVPSVNPALQQGLHFAVGRRLVFWTGGEVRVLEVGLDLAGQFWLESDRGARLAFLETPDLFACYDRRGPADLLLDAFALGIGLTPFGDGCASWRDAPAGRLVPRPWWARVLASRLPSQSRYQRVWEPDGRRWVQTGEHRAWLAPPVESHALISEKNGLEELRLSSGGQELLAARLVQVGLRPDAGVPGWWRPLEDTRPLAAKQGNGLCLARSVPR